MCVPQAALLSGEVGFDALYFGRIDYQDMDVRKAHKQLEFLWDASPSLGPSAGEPLIAARQDLLVESHRKGCYVARCVHGHLPKRQLRPPSGLLLRPVLQ